ncbi:MAG TPA: hypothetical protein PLI95_02400 [Polyangiaceae bacterium]|nr:hypothetical protein [Polyangiaceae bacterium]
MASRHRQTARSSLSTLLIAVCAVLTGCSKENKVDVTQGNACTVDADCADDGEACTIEKCKDRVCSWDEASDGAGCPEGQCWAGRCCTGCWDAAGEKCEKGLTNAAQCGVGGKACQACAADGACSTAAVCEAGKCVQKDAPNKTTCQQDGQELGACWDGACCTTCIRETCDVPGCEVGCQSAQKIGPGICGSAGRACEACTNNDDNPCTEPACSGGWCQELPVDGVQPECSKCQSGVCVVGKEGQPCSDTDPRCGQWLECIGEVCVKCGQNAEPCCVDDNTPTDCAGGMQCANGQCCSVDATAMQTDPQNCGACAHKCTDQLKNVFGIQCVAGQCVFSECADNHFDLDGNPANGCEACTSPFTLCSGPACVDLQSNNDHCGGCGIQCTAPASCASGGCSCAAPMLFCGNACTDPRSDPWSCGACGTSCPDTSMCTDSVCQPAAVLVVDSTEGVDSDAGMPADIHSFAADASHIYFARGNGLYKRPLGGGAVLKLVTAADGTIEHVQLRGGRVFFAVESPTTAGAAIVSSVLPDGTSRLDYAFQQALGQSVANYVVDDSSVYWLQWKSGLPGAEVRRRPIVGGMEQGPYVTGASDFGLCQDLILYAEPSGVLHTRKIGEATPETIDPKVNSRLIVGATADAIVFVANSGAVYRVPVATRKPVLVAAANVFPVNDTDNAHVNAGLLDGGRLVYPVQMTSGGQTTRALFALEIGSGAIAPRARFPMSMPLGTTHRYGLFGGKAYFWGGDPPTKIYREP